MGTEAESRVDNLKETAHMGGLKGNTSITRTPSVQCVNSPPGQKTQMG